MTDERTPPARHPELDVDSLANLSELGDDDLMLRVAGGSKPAFAALVNRHYAHLRAVAGRLVRTPALAEDAVQTTFLDILEGARRYEARGKFRAWVYGVMLNRCRMLQRRDRYDARLAEHVPPPLELVSPSDAVDAARFRRVTQAAVDALNPKLREVVYLRFSAGLTVPEIAHALAIPPGTVKSRLFNALEKLRISLPEGLFDGDG